MDVIFAGYDNHPVRWYLKRKDWDDFDKAMMRGCVVSALSGVSVNYFRPG